MNTLIKAAAIATAATFAGTAAMADAAFGQQSVVMDDTSLEIDLIVAEVDGTVAIFDYSMGGLGELLGTAPVFAGANADVLINLDRDPDSPAVAALLFEGTTMEPGMEVARIKVDVEDS